MKPDGSVRAYGVWTGKSNSTGRIFTLPSYHNFGFKDGKITQKPVKKVDGLVETYTTIFKDTESLNKFRKNFHLEEDREKWLKDNNVSFEIEYVEE